MKPKLTFVLFLGLAALLAGCISPANQAPSIVTLDADLAFEATPPIGFPTRKYTISKGEYTLVSHVLALSHYAAPDGLVSVSARDEETKPIPGGIGIDRSNGRFFVWKWDKSVGVVSLGAVTIYGEAGRDIHVFLAGIPKDLKKHITTR